MWAVPITLLILPSVYIDGDVRFASHLLAGMPENAVTHGLFCSRPKRSSLIVIDIACILPMQRPFELASKEQQLTQLQQQQQRANSGRSASSSRSSSPGPHLLLSRAQLAAQQQQVPPPDRPSLKPAYTAVLICPMRERSQETERAAVAQLIAS